MLMCQLVASRNAPMADDDDQSPDMLWLGSEFRRRGLPKPPDLTADQTKQLLSKCLLTPTLVTAGEIRDLAASVLYHLTSHHDS